MSTVLLRYAKTNSFISGSIFLTSVTIPTIWVYKKYKSNFDDKHDYLKEILKDSSTLNVIESKLGSPCYPTDYRKGRISSKSNLAKSTLKFKGPLGEGFLHTSAYRPLSLFLIPEDPLIEKATFSDFWNYPYLIKSQALKIIKGLFNKSQSIPLQAKQEYPDWKITSCMLVISPNCNDKLFSKLLQKAYLYSPYSILPIFGKLEDNPFFYSYTYRNVSTKHERAKKSIPFILLLILVFTGFLFGRQYFINQRKASTIKIVDYFIKKDSRLIPKFENAKILDMAGRNKDLFLDLEISLLGKQDDIASMKIRAHRYSRTDPFNIHSAIIHINDQKRINLLSSGQDLSI